MASNDMQSRHSNGIVLQPNLGWLGPRPATTKAEKIHQIKTDFIDDRALLITGALASDFAEYHQIPANMNAHNVFKCVSMLGKRSSFLIIQNLDEAAPEDQKKFIPLLKDRQILTAKLPDQVQILIPVKEVKKVLPEIQAVTFALKVS